MLMRKILHMNFQPPHTQIHSHWNAKLLGHALAKVAPLTALVTMRAVAMLVALQAVKQLPIPLTLMNAPFILQDVGWIVSDVSLRGKK